MSNSWICVDASLVVRLVVDPNDKLVWPQWEEWESDGLRFAAPSLIYFEVTNAIYQYQRHGLLSTNSVKEALEAALALPISLHGEADLHRKALNLTQRYSLSATYDVHYLALAEMLGVDFWTMDRRLFDTVSSDLHWVKLLR
ncbi:MAG: type II toxin-antitoxin system VapC family toxin [Chloroflexota bacterium]|jgi:predicted nucleic acid-binding protein